MYTCSVVAGATIPQSFVSNLSHAKQDIMKRYSVDDSILKHVSWKLCTCAVIARTTITYTPNGYRRGHLQKKWWGDTSIFLRTLHTDMKHIITNVIEHIHKEKGRHAHCKLKHMYYLSTSISYINAEIYVHTTILYMFDCDRGHHLVISYIPKNIFRTKTD